MGQSSPLPYCPAPTLPNPQASLHQPGHSHQAICDGREAHYSQGLQIQPLPPPLQPHPALLLGPRLCASLIELLTLPSAPGSLWPPGLCICYCLCLGFLSSSPLPSTWRVLANKNNSSLHLSSTHSVLSASQMSSYSIFTTTNKVKIIITDV